MELGDNEFLKKELLLLVDSYFYADPDPAFHFNADPDSAPFKVMGICDH
jgi:hypothetical protein